MRFFGSGAAQVIDYEDQDWPSDPWSRGGYMASPAPGILSSAGEAIRVPHGRVHWAGTETSDRWAGYIDGAIRSGDRAAAEDMFQETFLQVHQSADQFDLERRFRPWLFTIAACKSPLG